MKPSGARMLAALGMLLAMEIILSRFLSISAWNIKISLNFIPIAAAALLFGPLPAAIVAALGDFLGAILFPIGLYFPGFTFSAFLTGLVFGLFLYRREPRTLAVRTVCAAALNQLVISLLLNSFWISTLYGSPYPALLLSRLPQTIVMSAAQAILIPLLSSASERLRGRMPA